MRVRGALFLLASLALAAFTANAADPPTAAAEEAVLADDLESYASGYHKSSRVLAAGYQVAPTVDPGESGAN